MWDALEWQFATGYSNSTMVSFVRSKQTPATREDSAVVDRKARVGGTDEQLYSVGQIRVVRGLRQREGSVDTVYKITVPAQRERLCNFVEFERTRSNSEGDLH